MMQSTTTTEYGQLMRWYHVPAAVAELSQIFFVHYFLGTSRPWLMWTVIAARTTVLVVNFLVHPNFNFLSITSLRHVSLFGEQVTEIGAAATRVGWQQFGAASLILFLVYLVDAAVRRWRKGDKASKRRALLVIVGVVVPMLGEVVYGQLLLFGFGHGMFSNLPWYFGVQLVMANELVRDVILSRRALRETAEMQSQLARAERLNSLGQLASSLAHELAQPLSANILNAHVAMKKLNNEAPDLDGLRSTLANIESDSQYAAELITKIRKFSKSRAIELQPLAVEQLVTDVASFVGADLTSKRVALTFDIQPGLPNALGDRIHLCQVLLNLLTNSIQAVHSCPPDARHIAVEAHEVRGKDRIEVVVRDSGHGVPDDVAEEIFRPFFTTKSDGMGMGLALSRDIIEAHGGHLRVDRTNGQGGAVFRFTLQRA
jgi:signal transduction histidine kinase